jgi:hypothetical protein
MALSSEQERETDVQNAPKVRTERAWLGMLCSEIQKDVCQSGL